MLPFYDTLFAPIVGAISVSPMGATILALIIAILSFALGRGAKSRDNKEAAEFAETTKKLEGMLGKLQRMESTINDLRTESLRNAEQIKRELFLAISKTKKGSSEDEGGSSSGQGGSDEGGTSSGGTGSIFSSTEDETSRELKDIIPTTSIIEEAAPLTSRLSKWRKGIFDKVRAVFGLEPTLTEAQIEELEAELIGADLGVHLTKKLITDLNSELSKGKQITEVLVKDKLKQAIYNSVSFPVHTGEEIQPESVGVYPRVVLVVGVNGVGKTTTTAKLASQLINSGASVMLVAADTFRAAAVDQLKSWGTKLGVQVVSGSEGAKPQTVVFDGMKKALEERIDVVLIDTAGRLHNKSHLMQELEGVKNSISRHIPDAPHETLLVVDGSSGQNALQQARDFNEVTPLSGLVVTKLDGTPKGGIVVAIAEELKIPVRYIGVGESEKDLRVFNPTEFVDALFDEQGLTVEGTTAHAETRRKRREETALIQ